MIIRKILTSPFEKVKGNIFNAGSDAQNYTKKDVVEILKKVAPKVKAKYIDSVHDRRDYKVNFEKLRKTLGFNPTRTVEYGFKELINSFKRGLLTKYDFDANKLEVLKNSYAGEEKILTRE